MDGLEAVELSFNEFVVNENETFRIDSEYFRKSLLEKTRLIKKLSFNILETIAEVKGGKRLPLGEDFVDVGIPYIRAEDVKNSFVQHKNSPCISEKTYSQIASYQTNQNDVLLTIVGNSIGDVGIVKFQLDRCNLTENCVKIFPKRGALPDASDYLFLFFMSSYGQAQIERERVGTAQPKLAIERIRRFMVPALSVDMQHLLAGLVASANEQLKESEQEYQQAEQTLLRALGLENWEPANQRTAIKDFSQSFDVAGRLDAEYYQPKYDGWAECIKQHPAGFDELGKVCQVKEENFSPDEAKVYRYIELADIGSHGNITGATEDVGAALPTRARRRVVTGDVVVSSIEGSLQSLALVTDDYDNTLCSTGFYVVRSDTINPETLLVLFKSEAYQNLFKQACTGTILTAMPKEFFGRIPVPVIDTTVQRIIAEKVQASFAARHKSQKLLELAKQAVERAIESSEAEALSWLQVQMQQV